MKKKLLEYSQQFYKKNPAAIVAKMVEKTYTKAGEPKTAHEFQFILFDEELKSFGTISERQYQNFLHQTPKKQQGEAA